MKYFIILCTALIFTTCFVEKNSRIENQRFTDNNNGTITDNQTNLIWLKNPGLVNNGNDIGNLSWYDAINLCSSIQNGKGGLTDGSKPDDWRLPTINELQSLIDYDFYGLALTSGHPFVELQKSYYWSVTTYASDTARAWICGLNSGAVRTDVKTHLIFVLPVKNIQKLNN